MKRRLLIAVGFPLLVVAIWPSTLAYGVPQDVAEAVRLFRAAADRGLAEAQYYLGTLYTMGRGVYLSHTDAYMWFELAERQNHARAAKLRRELAGVMSAEQKAEATARARRWLEEHGQE